MCRGDIRGDLGLNAHANSLNSGSVADTRDLQKVFEEVSGKDLKQFFDQWLYTTGQPELEIKWKYDGTGKFITVDITQLQEKAFSFPLLLKFNYSKDSKVEKIFVKDATSSFKIKADKKPVSLIVDPNTELLMKSMSKEK